MGGKPRVAIKPRFQGVDPHRYKDNLLEFEFAQAWQRVNDRSRGATFVDAPGYLDYLLNSKTGLPPASDRDHLVAATVIQWLGSHVGIRWLTEILSKNEAKEFRYAVQLAENRYRRVVDAVIDELKEAAASATPETAVLELGDRLSKAMQEALNVPPAEG